MIGIFDSGLGGLSVFREIVKLLPDADYIYWSDDAHCPYGEKTQEYITDRARKISEFMIREGADIVVVACNTATGAAIATLRAEFSNPGNKETRQKMMILSDGRIDHIRFIGMEPAVKPAIELTHTGVIGVLATVGTLKADKYKHTKALADGKVRVVEHIGQGFVELVESGRISGPQVDETVKRSLRPLLDAGADTIVLGCTHYPFLLSSIRKIAGDGITIIDPAPAVAKHLVEVLKEENLLEKIKSDGHKTVRLYSSSGNNSKITDFYTNNILKQSF